MLNFKLARLGATIRFFSGHCFDKAGQSEHSVKLSDGDGFWTTQNVTIKSGIRSLNVGMVVAVTPSAPDAAIVERFKSQWR